MSDPFKVLILVCSVDQAPPECHPDAVLDVIIGPTAASEMVCARDGQAGVAQTSFVVAGETYQKILCTRVLAQATPEPARSEVFAASTGSRMPRGAHRH